MEIKAKGVKRLAGDWAKGRRAFLGWDDRQ